MRANRYRSELDNARSAVWSLGIADALVTFGSFVLFAVLLIKPPFNPLLMYMLLNVLHLFFSPALFAIANRTSAWAVGCTLWFAAAVFAFDMASFVIRSVGFGFCAACTEPRYLVGTLFPYATNFVFLLMDMSSMHLLYKLKRGLEYEALVVQTQTAVRDSMQFNYQPTRRQPYLDPYAPNSAQQGSRYAPTSYSIAQQSPYMPDYTMSAVPSYDDSLMMNS